MVTLDNIGNSYQCLSIFIDNFPITIIRMALGLLNLGEFWIGFFWLYKLISTKKVMYICLSSNFKELNEIKIFEVSYFIFQSRLPKNKAQVLKYLETSDTGHNRTHSKGLIKYTSWMDSDRHWGGHSTEGRSTLCPLWFHYP